MTIACPRCGYRIVDLRFGENAYVPCPGCGASLKAHDWHDGAMRVDVVDELALRRELKRLRA